jgi:hypothetical protein
MKAEFHSLLQKTKSRLVELDKNKRLGKRNSSDSYDDILPISTEPNYLKQRIEHLSL